MQARGFLLIGTLRPCHLPHASPKHTHTMLLFSFVSLPSITASVEQFSPFSFWHTPPEKSSPTMLAPCSVHMEKMPLYNCDFNIITFSTMNSGVPWLYAGKYRDKETSYISCLLDVLCALTHYCASVLQQNIPFLIPWVFWVSEGD